MTSSINYGIGMAMTCLGGAVTLAASYKSDLSILKKLTPDLKAAIGSTAYLFSLETIKCFVEESDPFWKGVSKAMPIVALLTGSVIGQTLQEEDVAAKDPDILVSPQYKENLNSWAHSLRVALSCGLLSVISPSIVAYPVAGAAGSLIGRLYIQDAADKAREVLKKSQ